MSNVVVGGLFVIVGVLVSLLGQVTYDAWRSRRRVNIAVESVRAVIGRTTTSFRMHRLGEERAILASGMIYEIRWVYASSSEPGAFLVLSFVLNIQNASQLDDAVVAAEVSVSTSQGPLTSAVPYVMESRFYGASVSSHGYLALKMDFALAVTAADGFGDGQARTDVSCTLALRTIRGQDFSFSTSTRLKMNPSKSTGAILPQPALPPDFVTERGAVDEPPTSAGK